LVGVFMWIVREDEDVVEVDDNANI